MRYRAWEGLKLNRMNQSFFFNPHSTGFYTATYKDSITKLNISNGCLEILSFGKRKIKIKNESKCAVRCNRF